MPISFTWPIFHCGYRLHLEPPLPRPQELYIGIYNIRYGQGFEISQVIWEVQVGGFDLVVLKETKVTGQDYFRNRLG